MSSLDSVTLGTPRGVHARHARTCMLNILLVSEPVISYNMGSDGTSSVMMGGAVVGTDILGIRGDTSAAPGYIQA